MTYAERLIVAGSNGTSQFRQWGSGINALLTAAGLTQTADTGQINWTTVTVTSSANVLIGYEVWSIPDTIGTLRMRLDYMTTAAYDGAVTWRPTIGTGSDGAGTITGVRFASLNPTYISNSATDATAYPAYASSWNGGFAIAVGVGHPTARYRRAMVLDRTCDSSGTQDNKGMVFAFCYPYESGSQYHATIVKGWTSEIGGGVEATFPYSPACLPYNHGTYVPSMVINDKRPIAIAKHATPSPRYHKNFAIGWGPDFGPGSVATATILGSSKTYRSCGVVQGDLNGRGQQSGDFTAALLIPWE